MTINNLEKVTINSSEQWILVRGKTDNAPLIIHVQAGPGLPIIPEANAMEKLLHLENDYLIAYWDQRACGKSFSKNIDPKTINFSQLADDIISCTRYLIEKYKKDKAVIIGYSIGATSSLIATQNDSKIFDRLFLVGIDIDVPSANKHAIKFALSKSKETNNRKFLKQAVDLINTPITSAKPFQKRAKLLTNLGGIQVNSSYNQLLISTVSNILFSRAYCLSDIPKTIKGMEFCQNAFLPELDKLNLFDKIKSVDIPVHFIQGKQDSVAPYQITVDYYNYLQADTKTLTCFENSAHFPHYDEPRKFANLLRDTINK
jgi:pimeloyl-ACP methyl ester carboxylesterase